MIADNLGTNECQSVDFIRLMVELWTVDNGREVLGDGCIVG